MVHWREGGPEGKGWEWNKKKSSKSLSYLSIAYVSPYGTLWVWQTLWETGFESNNFYFSYLCHPRIK